jgi:glycosyltransferase involved in cell wall biosynthesis
LGEPKLYRALLNSQSREFKRHDLAFNVKNLAWITYNEVGIADRIGELVAQYRYLDYVNYSQETGSVLLDGAQLRRILNRARCGLALSGEEGPNNASMEYFLCGLPLVTTPAKGGREEMYDPRHVRIVAPEPDAVEHAVAYFCAHPIDPMEIRASALRKAMPHRARLIEWLSGVASRDLLAESGDNYWLPQFCDKFRQTWEIDEQDDGSWTADPIHGWALPTLLGEVPPFTAVNSASASDTALGRRSPD